MRRFLPTKAISQSHRDDVDLNVLRALAESSGGRAFLLAETLIGRGTQIDKVLDTIADELRSQYTLGFYPAKPDDGRFHQLEVRVRSGDLVRARRGYVATSSQTRRIFSHEFNESRGLSSSQSETRNPYKQNAAAGCCDAQRAML